MRINKSQLIRVLEQYNQVLTVNELTKQLRDSIEKSEIEQIEAEQKVVDKYTDKYLIILSICELMGKGVECIHIKSLKPGSMTTEWERTYDCEISNGFSFDKRSVYNRDYKRYTCDSSYTEKELESFTQISSEQFYEMELEHSNIKEKIEKIIATYFNN